MQPLKIATNSENGKWVSLSKLVAYFSVNIPAIMKKPKYSQNNFSKKMVKTVESQKKLSLPKLNLKEDPRVDSSQPMPLLDRLHFTS